MTVFSSSSAEQLELEDVSSRENSTSTSFFSTEVTEVTTSEVTFSEVTASEVITVFDLDLSCGMEDCCHVCVILHICETNLPIEVKLSKICYAKSANSYSSNHIS